MNSLLTHLSSLLLISPLPLLSQYQVNRTDPLASLTKELRLFSLEAQDGTTATLRCPSYTKVFKLVATVFSN